MTALLVVGGLVTLTLGAELLVRGASRLAAGIGVAPLVVGLTVVALGTSAPEVAVSVGSALAGRGDIAVGNVVGSNVLNVLLVLGLSAVITPLLVSRQLVRREVPVLVVLSGGVLAMAVDGRIETWESALLVISAAAYLVVLGLGARAARGSARASSLRSATDPLAGDGDPAGSGPDASAGGPGDGGDPGGGSGLTPREVAVSVLQVLAGVLGLVAGAHWLVEGATSVARAVGVSELVVGLTVVALGTSLPELATCIAAAVRDEVDLLVGNVVGSNLLNLMLVLGAAGLVAPGGLAVPPAAWSFDLPVMVSAAVACLPIFFTGYRISRWEGVFFLAYYAAYLLFLVLDATGHGAVPRIREMAVYVLPITVVTAAVVGLRHRRAGGRG
jgi:cation:H+ antiporter